MPDLRVFPISGIPEVHPGDDLAALIADASKHDPLQTGDVLVVTQKVVSKAEGRIVDLKTVTPSPFAEALAAKWEKDARQIEVILGETRRIVRMDHGVLIVETHHGFVCANAGVDHSNVPGDDRITLLPVDSDASAQKIRTGILQRAGVQVAVIVSDTFGRPWREGTTEVAIGVAGMDPIWDYRGREDAYGHVLRSTEIAQADQLASAAGLVLEKAAGTPVAVIRGFPYTPTEGTARPLVRAPEKDLFR